MSRLNNFKLTLGYNITYNVFNKQQYYCLYDINRLNLFDFGEKHN